MIDGFIQELNDFSQYVTKHQYLLLDQEKKQFVSDTQGFSERSNAVLLKCEELIANLDHNDITHEQLEKLQYALYLSNPILSHYHDPSLGELDEIFTQRYRNLIALLTERMNGQLAIKPMSDIPPSVQKTNASITNFSEDINQFLKYLIERQFETRRSDGAHIANRDEFYKKCEDCTLNLQTFYEFFSRLDPKLIDMHSLRELKYSLDKWFNTLSEFHEPLLTGIIEPFKEYYAEQSRLISQLIDERLTPPPDAELRQASIERKTFAPRWKKQVAHSSPSSSSSNSVPFLSIETFKKNGKLYSNKPWLDIPSTSILIAQYSLDLQSSTKLNTILDYVDHYHSIDKSSRIKILGRVALLTYINNLCNEYLASGYLPSNQSIALESLSAQAASKALYLENIRKKVMDDLFAIEHQLSGARPGLLLRTFREGFTNILMLDPCSRGSDPSFVKLFESWKQAAENNEPINSSFLMWLETQDENTQHIPGLGSIVADQFSLNEQAVNHFFRLNRAKIVNGKFCDSTGNALHSKHINPSTLDDTQYGSFGTDHVYAIDELGKFYIAPFSQCMGHAFIIQDGYPVACAGTLAVKNGIVVEIGNDSGHYAATPAHLQQAVDILKRERLISPTAVVNCCYFDKDGTTKQIKGNPDMQFGQIDFYRNINGQWMNNAQIAELVQGEIQAKKARPKF